MRQSEQQTIINTLMTNRLFASCSPEKIEQIATKATLQRLPKGNIIFLHEQPAEACYVIKNGWIKLFRETLDGDQAIVDILTTTHKFGETALFNDGLYPFSAEVVENTELVKLPIAVLKSEIENNNQFAFSMLNAMARYRRQQDHELEHRNLQNASQRIGCFLLRLADQRQKGIVTLHLPYDKMLLASRLGMQRETFSRALAKLKDETGLRIKGATIEVDSLENLSRFSCVACSSDYPCKDS